jgi:hypothetical protein
MNKKILRYSGKEKLTNVIPFFVVEQREIKKEEFTVAKAEMEKQISLAE